MDPHGTIYPSAEPSPEDKARLDGYLRGQAVQQRLVALGDYYERLAGIAAAESPSTKTLSGPDVAAISAAERLEHQLFTAEEVRKIAWEVAFPGRVGLMMDVLREHGISAESPSQPVPQPPTPAPQPPPPGA